MAREDLAARGPYGLNDVQRWGFFWEGVSEEHCGYADVRTGERLGRPLGTAFHTIGISKIMTK